MRKLSLIGLGIGIGLLALAVFYTASAHAGGYGPMTSEPSGGDNPYPTYGIPGLPGGFSPFWMQRSYQPYGYGSHCSMMGW